MFVDDLLMFARADSASFQHVFDAFSKFSQASGLEANLDKGHLYIGGVEMNHRDILQSVVHIPLGSFPFKYLGVPLTTRKLFYNECKPLIEKTMTSVRVWFVEKLSYAARLQLVNAILHGFQLYWCQIFVLPKKVFKEIQNICRVFLWTGQDSSSKKASIAWEALCLPKSYRGMSIKNLAL